MCFWRHSGQYRCLWRYLGHESDASFSPWMLLMVPACSILVIPPTRLCHLRFRDNFYRVENFIVLEELEDLKRIFLKKVMKPGWIIWWWLFDREMFSLVLGICMLGPQLVALLVWHSLIGRKTSEGHTLRCKTYFYLQFQSLLPACSWGRDLSLCFC